MRTVSAFFRAVLAAAIAMILVPVLEGGQWVWKATKAVLGASSPTADALAEQDAVIALAAPAAPVMTTAEEWGRGALHRLLGEHTPESRALDSAARAYLDNLNEGEVFALTRYSNRLIGEHLLGQRDLGNVPLPPSPVERLKAKTAELDAENASLRASVGDSKALCEQDAITQSILDDLLDESARSWAPKVA